MSEQRSIQQISSQETPLQQWVCMNVVVCVSACSVGACICVLLKVRPFIAKPVSVAHQYDLQGHLIGQVRRWKVKWMRGGGGGLLFRYASYMILSFDSLCGTHKNIETKCVNVLWQDRMRLTARVCVKSVSTYMQTHILMLSFVWKVPMSLLYSSSPCSHKQDMAMWHTQTHTCSHTPPCPVGSQDKRPCPHVCECVHPLAQSVCSSQCEGR